MSYYLVEYGIGENVAQVTEWFAVSRPVLAEDYLHAAIMACLNEDGLLYRVTMMVENEFGALEKKGFPCYYSQEDL